MTDTRTLEADYLIIGCGAMAMAFADTMITETDARIIMVDRRHRPGGHWNDSYPFVRLHQPSAFYGVNSRELAELTTNEDGTTKGLQDLASGAKICGYFDDVMQKQLLPSNRLQYFPMCNYTGDGQFSSLLSGTKYTVNINKRIVDATFTDTAIPATHKPNYRIDEDVAFIPLNGLTQIQRPFGEYVVIGAGKTGIDACLWLLDNEVSPEKITWVMSRDSWLLDRANLRAGDENFEFRILSSIRRIDAINNATSVNNLFELLQKKGEIIALDENITPTMYRCATVSQEELIKLRRIHNIIRFGRVNHIQKTKIKLEKSILNTHDDTLYIDCSADGLKRRKARPVFQDNAITLQNVRICQPTFSSALIAHVEATYESDDHKNKLTSVIPYPNAAIDWLSSILITFTNQYLWSQDKNIQNWLKTARLDFVGAKNDAVYAANGIDVLLQRYKESLKPALKKLQYFLNQQEENM